MVCSVTLDQRIAQLEQILFTTCQNSLGNRERARVKPHPCAGLQQVPSATYSAGVPAGSGLCALRFWCHLPKTLRPSYPQSVSVCLATSEKSTRTMSGVTSWLPGGYAVPSASMNMRKLTQERLFLGPY